MRARGTAQSDPSEASWPLCASVSPLRESDGYVALCERGCFVGSHFLQDSPAQPVIEPVNETAEDSPHFSAPEAASNPLLLKFRLRVSLFRLIFPSSVRNCRLMKPRRRAIVVKRLPRGIR